EDLSPLLAGIPREMPYSVPAGYFSRTLEDLPALTGEEHASSILASIRKTMPYEVPSGYFEQLPGKILALLSRQQARVVPILSRKWMRMAVAAMVGGIICISGYTYFLSQGKQPSNGSAVVATLQSM